MTLIIMESSLVVPDGTPDLAEALPVLKGHGFRMLDIADMSLGRHGFMMAVNYLFIRRAVFDPYRRYAL